MAKPKETSLPSQLLWLADSPSFIDGEQIDRFYDAVVRPYNRQGVTTLGSDSEFVMKLAAELGVGAEFDSGKLLDFLSTWLPKLKVNVDGKVESSGDFASSSSTQTDWHPIETPQRQLEQLVLHYLFYQESRLEFDAVQLDAAPAPKWAEPDWIKEIPRGLVLLDFPAGTKFIPTYAEYGEKSVSGEIFKKLPGAPDAYPEEPDENAKCGYWQEFANAFKVQPTVVAVEKGGGENAGRIQVIDFRVPISEDGKTLHLHLYPRGEYPTITFAYNLIRRGFEHGVRLVGTMRSEPDMSVLAIYEK